MSITGDGDYLVKADAVREFWPGSNEGETYTQPYWITVDSKTFLIQRAVVWLVGAAPATEAACPSDVSDVGLGCARYTVEYHDYGAAVTREVPEV